MSNIKMSYFDASACAIEDFKALIDRTLDQNEVPFASDVQQNIPVYDMADLRPMLDQSSSRQKLMAEWAHVLLNGSGAIVLQNAYADTSIIDKATHIYEAIIASEKETAGSKNDHFAASGANDRIWNSLQKLCEQNAEVFLHYFSNTSIAAACEAWLGPNYQMTAQVNLVHPGGAAQLAHRDYHLGFQTADISATYPAHVHDLSPVLTLQGAIAHCDMPLESGPTKLLPFSQAYRPGYAAWRMDSFRALFEERHIQLPLAKGDALFFSPAIFHGAGANTSSDIHRMANLLQISSAFGRAMETINRQKMCQLTYPSALQAQKNGTLKSAEIMAAIAATAEGYSFPTNLDQDPPAGGLAPETQQAFYNRALKEQLSPAEFEKHLDLMQSKQSA